MTFKPSPNTPSGEPVVDECRANLIMGMGFLETRAKTASCCAWATASCSGGTSASASCTRTERGPMKAGPAPFAVRANGKFSYRNLRQGLTAAGGQGPWLKSSSGYGKSQPI